MLSFIRTWLAWRLVGDELAELERWRFGAVETSKWMAEFPDASAALVHLQAVARDGRSYAEIVPLRNALRHQRQEALEK